jgi:outer membrane protein
VILIPAFVILGLGQDQAPITAFPNGPKAPAPRVKDLAVPPAPVAPGPLGGQNPLPASEPLTADEAARIALKLQPSLGQQVGAIQAQKGVTGQIGSAAKPQVGGDLGYNQISSISGQPSTGQEAPNLALPVGSSPVYRYASAAAIHQLLYDFNRTRSLVRQSEALEGAAKANLTIAQEDLVLDVEQAFYNYQSALRLVRVNEDNVANRQRQLDLTTALFTSGIGRPSDVAIAQASKSQAVLGLNQARDAAEQTRIQLLEQMGVDPMTPLSVAETDAPEPSSRDPRTLTDHALRTRPEVLAAERNVVAARFGLSAARAADLPTLYAQAGAGLAGMDFPLKQNTSSLAVGLSIPIVDGGYRAGAIQQAHGEILSAESALKTVFQQVRTDVASAYMALQSAEQRISITGNEVFNAAEALRLAEGRYSAGVGLFLDITSAQSILLSAQTDQANARNALAQARTLLSRATGDFGGYASPL